jgi:hypothetical protein
MLTTFFKKSGLSLIVLCCLLACNSGEKIPDISSIKIELKTKRLDKDLAAIDTNNVATAVKALQPQYPDFLDFYLDTLMGFGIKGNYSDTCQAMRQGLRSFLTHKDYKGLFDTVKKHYPDTKATDEALEMGFRFMKFYYPNYRVPQIIYLISGLGNWGAFTLSGTTVGVGLDMFLGPEYPFYKSVGLPEYMGRHFQSDYIPVAVFSAIYQDMYPLDLENKSLLEMMIEKGKLQYFLSKVLPRTDDSLRLAYSPKQLDWCKKNEGLIYNFFIKENLFYSKEWQKILRYVNDGPNSTGMPPESPGNIGSWLGLQIVRSYMKNHPETTLPQLFSMKSAPQNFLEDSKYKPR